MNIKELIIRITKANGTISPITKEFICNSDNGFRCQVEIEKGGLPSKNFCNISIFGVSQETAENFTSTVFLPLTYDVRNTVEVIYENATIFKGTYIKCVGNYSSFPDISLDLTAYFGYETAISPTKTTSIAEGYPVVSAVSDLAKLMGYQIINNYNLTNKCPQIELFGTNFDKLQQLEKACKLNIIATDGYIGIAPVNKPVFNTPIEINAGTGMIGYPSFTSDGLNFKTLFNPLLRNGGLANVKTIVPKASGIWYVASIYTKLSTLENGVWETEASCYVNS